MAAGAQNSASAMTRPKADLRWSMVPPARATGMVNRNQNRDHDDAGSIPSEPDRRRRRLPALTTHTSPRGGARTCLACIGR